ncbi:putative 12-oxophytodienoate reductase 11 [Tanacetum coccineum]
MPRVLKAKLQKQTHGLMKEEKKCPFDAIEIINLPKDLEKDTTHRHGVNTFKFHRFFRTDSDGFEPNAGKPPVSSAEKPCSPLVESTGEVLIEFVPPQRLDSDEIPLVANDFRIAAKNVMEAGFDGVEIHMALGNLIEQFLKDEVNDQTDKYGGSLENRCRFAFEVIETFPNEIVADKVGIRLSPFATYLDSGDNRAC